MATCILAGIIPRTGAWRAIVHGVAELDTTEHIPSTHITGIIRGTVSVYEDSLS